MANGEFLKEVHYIFKRYYTEQEKMKKFCINEEGEYNRMVNV